jgi:hypothetical protein
MSIEFKIYDGLIRCKERIEIIKNIIEDNEMDKEERKCLLIYDEAKLRIGRNDNIQVPLMRRNSPGYMVDGHQMNMLCSNFKNQNITFLVQCLGSKKPFWFVLFTENFDRATAEILRDQLQYCIDTIKFLGLDLENIVTDMASHHVSVTKYFPDQNFTFDLLHCLDNIIKALVKNSLRVNKTKLNFEIIKKLGFNNYQCFKPFFLTAETSGSATYQSNKGTFFQDKIISDINTKRSGLLVKNEIIDNEITEMGKFLEMVNSAYKLLTQDTNLKIKIKQRQ